MRSSSPDHDARIAVAKLREDRDIVCSLEGLAGTGTAAASARRDGWPRDAAILGQCLRPQRRTCLQRLRRETAITADRGPLCGV